VDPKRDKASKLEELSRLEQQYMHDVLITSKERKDAVKDFMLTTDFKGNSGTTDSIT